MKNFKLTYDLAAGPDVFFGWFFEQKREEDLYKGELRYADYRTVKRDESPAELTRTAAFKRQWNIPTPLAKLLGSDFRQTEDGVFDKHSSTWRSKVTPSTAADKLREESELTVTPAGGGCRIQVEYWLECKMFGVGGLMESTFENLLREEWDQIATFYKKHQAAT